MRTILTAALASLLVTVAVVRMDAQGAAQQPLQNLQVLPKTMTRPEVTALMRGVTAALGVQCNHCHVGSPTERFKDDLPAKAMARKMFAMMFAINDDLLKDVGTVPADGARRVTCYTCHRGALKVPTGPQAGGGLIQ